MTEATLETPQTGRFVRALKEAAVSALVALGIAGPLIGLRTRDSGPIGLIERWDAVAYTVAIVFFGRLVLSLFLWQGTRIVPPLRLPGLQQVGAAAGRSSIVLVPLLLLFAFVLPFLPFADRRIMDLSILILTYIMLGWGLNIVVGLAGLLDLGYVAFYAVGAYSYALLAQHFDWGFWVCLPIAGMLAGMWGMILGFPVLRLRGDYLAIVTLAFGEIIRIVLLNWASFTGGPNGISGVPRPTFFGLDFTREGGFADYFGLEYTPLHRIIFLYYLILLLALLTNYVTMRLRRLPIGRAWEALREDEIACRALGLNTTNTKLTAFAIGAMFAGFAGSFFATRQGFISPESFVFMESALVLATVVLGGLGSQIGVAIAAVVMIGGIEALRSLEFLKWIFGPEFDPAQYRMLIFGLAMVLIMVWRPKGLISTRAPSVRLHPDGGATRLPTGPSAQRQAEEAAT